MLIELSTHRRNTPRDLVDLLAECHARIRRFVELAYEAAIRTDAPVDQVIQACADVERYFVEALPLHVTDEEESIAPRLRGMSSEVDHALDLMTRQHQEHSPTLAGLLSASARVRADPSHRGARDELAKAAKALKIEFDEHLTLEETVIFPAIRGLLSHETRDLIVDELRGRRQQGGAKEQSSTNQHQKDES